MSDPQSLADFESTLTPSNNISEEWFSSVLTSFTLIEPWTDARSSYWEVQEIIESVKERSVVYYEALEGSRLVAQQGFLFSKEAFKLCGYLQEENEVDAVAEYIDDMEKIVNDALKKVQKVSEQFRSARVGFIQVTKGVPKNLDKLETQTEHALASKNQAEKKMKSFLKTAEVISSAAVILPVVLDLADLFKETGEHHYMKKIDKRQARVMRLEEASDKLVQIGSNMEELIKRIDKFVDWWISQDTVLTYLRQQIEHLHANGIRKTRIQALRSEWNEAANKFQFYVMMVSKLQDCLPASQRAIEGELINPTSEAAKPKKGLRKFLSAMVKGN